MLVARGCTIEIMTPGPVVGQDLGISLDTENLRRRARAATTTDRVVVGARNGAELDVPHHTTGEVAQVRYGCLAPGRVHSGVIEGERVGAAL